MEQPSPTLILYPLFAMFLLVALVLAHMARSRLGAVSRREVSIDYYKDYRDTGEPEHLRVIARHFSNLFELPILFYVAVIVAYVTQEVSYSMIALAWAYVVTRYIHSYVHLGSNDVPTRFRAYFASVAVLAVLWLSLLVRLLSA